MLKVGDIVRYHGREHNAQSRQGYVGTEWRIAPYDRIREDKRCVIQLQPHGHSFGGVMNVYYGDVELAGLVAPEEYEKWFV